MQFLGKWNQRIERFVFKRMTRTARKPTALAVMVLLGGCPLAHAQTNPEAPGHCAMLSQNPQQRDANTLICAALPGTAPLFRSDASLAGPGPETGLTKETKLTPEQDRDLKRLQALVTLLSNNLPRKSTADSAQAAWILGLLSLHGMGVPADAARARQYFEMAWRHGYRLASAGLSWCAIEGCGVPQDLKLASFWQQRLTEINKPRALYFEWLIQNERAPLRIRSEDGEKSPNRVSNLGTPLIAAAKSGDVQAHIELGVEAASKGLRPEALNHFELASARSKTALHNAQLIRAQMTQKETTDQGQAQSAPGMLLFEQALRYHRGEGVIQNYSEAIKRYQAASALGNVHARRMLTLIFSRTGPDGQIDVNWMNQLGQLDVREMFPQLAPPHNSSWPSKDITPLVDFLPPLWQQ